MSLMSGPARSQALIARSGTRWIDLALSRTHSFLAGPMCAHHTGIALAAVNNRCVCACMYVRMYVTMGVNHDPLVVVRERRS